MGVYKVRDRYVGGHIYSPDHEVVREKRPVKSRVRGFQELNLRPIYDQILENTLVIIKEMSKTPFILKGVF